MRMPHQVHAWRLLNTLEPTDSPSQDGAYGSAATTTTFKVASVTPLARVTWPARCERVGGRATRIDQTKSRPDADKKGFIGLDHPVHPHIHTFTHAHPTESVALSRGLSVESRLYCSLASRSNTATNVAIVSAVFMKEHLASHTGGARRGFFDS